jgi:putative MATE family efflux protein
METRQKKMELLGQVPVKKALLLMGLPTMVGMMINALYNLIDAFFVGGLGTNQMAAISVTFPLTQVIVGLGLLFGNGAASYLSRLLGQNKQKMANKVASTAIYCSLLVGILIIAVTFVCLKPILQLMGARGAVLPYAMTYASIYLLFSIFNIFNVTMNNIVSSEGAAKTTMAILITSAVLNAALAPVFIKVLHLGIAGAAYATAIAQIVSSLLYLWYILRKRSVFSFSIKAFSPSKEIMSEILKIGIPTLIFQLLTSLSIALTNDNARLYGNSALAAMGAVTRILSMGSLVVFGFLKGLQPIAGFSYGAKKYERLQSAIKISIIWSSLFCALFAVVSALFSSSIISGFTQNDWQMVQIGTQALRVNALSFVLFGFYTTYSSLLLAMGKAKEGLFLGACRQGLCFIPVILVLPRVFGLNGVIYAQLLADILSALITAWLAIRLHKELREDKANQLEELAATVGQNL